MPYAADPAIRGGQLPLSHNPLLRINYNTPKPPVDLGDIAAKLLEFVQDLLLDAIKDVTGLDLSSGEAFWNSIVSIVTQTFTGVEGGLEQLEEWAHTIAQDAADAVNQLAALIDRALGIGHSVEDFVVWLETFLTPDSSLNAANLWGLLPKWVSLTVPSTSVTGEPAQPLWNPNFEGAISLAPGLGWSWDSTVYNEDSTVMPGSAKVIADGTVHALRSNGFPVSPGQTLAIQIPVLVSGVTSTGSPIGVDVITYEGMDSLTLGTQVALENVAAIPKPTGFTTGWTNPPAGSKGGTLSGTYTVPDGVDGVVLRLVLDATATAGSVWFGSVEVTITGGLIADIQTGVETIQDDEAAKAAATAALWQDIGTAITTWSGSNWTAMLVDINTAYRTWYTAITGINADEAATVQDMIESIFGINISTGQNAQWAAVMAQITALQTLLASPPVSASAWAAWWTATLEALGVGSTDAVNTANFLSGNYDAAKQAKAWWDQFLAGLGWTTGAQAAGTVNNHTSSITTQLGWWSRLPEDLWIVFADPFHLTYELGSLSDTPTTVGTNGKRTFRAAQADIKLLLGQTSSATTTITTPSDVGGAVKTIAGAGSVGTVAPTQINDQVLPAQVAGPDGSVDLSGTVDALFMQLAEALGGNVTGAGDLAPLAQLVRLLNDQSNETTLQAAAATAALEIRNNAPVFESWDDTGQANMAPLSISNNAQSAAGFTCGAFIRIRKSARIGAVTFVSNSATSSITAGTYINIWRVNFTTGTFDFIHGSSDQSALWTGLTSNPTPIQYVLPGPSNFQVYPGDVIAVELSGAALNGRSVYGSGNNLAGMLTNTHANLKSFGFAVIGRSAPAVATGPVTISSGITWQHKAPYVSLEITNTPASYVPPDKWTRSTVGSYTYVVPSWVVTGDLVDLITLGGGGGGGFQNSGAPGGWATRTLVVGTDVNAGDSLTVAVGRGGSHTIPAYNGDPTTIKKGVTTLLSGAGGADYANAASYTQSPGNIDFPVANPTRYFGGGNVGLKIAGAKPGGGGCWTGDANASYNTPGAPGAAWIVTRQQ